MGLSSEMVVRPPDWVTKRICRVGYELRTVRAAIEVNNDQKTTLYRKAANRLITFSGLKVAVLGLTFKPGTDDLREAPSLANVPLLLERGAQVYAYDPAGSANFSRRYPEGEYNISYVAKPAEALSGANVCFIFTEWDEIKAVRPDDYKRLMRTPLVYDGRNIYGIEEMLEAGVEYYSIGRQAVGEDRAGKTGSQPGKNHRLSIA